MMVDWLVSPGFGVPLTVLALGLAFTATLLVEFGLYSPRIRQRVFVFTGVVLGIWLGIVALRFVALG